MREMWALCLCVILTAGAATGKEAKQITCKGKVVDAEARPIAPVHRN